MLLNSVVLLLREVLEAAVLVSVLASLAHTFTLGFRWFTWALLPASLGVMLYANALPHITDWLNGAGQEVVNVGLQSAVFLVIGAIVFVLASYHSQELLGLARISKKRLTHLLPSLFGAAVVCAAIREGSEIYIYISGFTVAPELRVPVFSGSAIGAGIGVSLGILLFYFLTTLPRQRSFRFCLSLLALIGAGMVVQATVLLEQIDWLSGGAPVWDTTALVPEQSLLGELLYAVFGYESTPSIYQVLLYLGSLIFVSGAYFFGRRFRKS